MKQFMILFIAVFSVFAFIGCGPLQQATSIGGGQYEIQITGNSMNPLEITSDLTKAFHEKAKSICSNGYTVLNKQIARGRGHKSDTMIGTIQCK
ncbi:hypothetical protein [uncultured Desulfosarcina sp.]|uniref:hypothetical protein n=1 Tax=uncultured Desulfosarcina sp. TaxID=218289 RepID=UPI0029C6C2D0|nr:hypothetical protein [uncultured Desulfosarcina sp.]